CWFCPIQQISEPLPHLTVHVAQQYSILQNNNAKVA
ncbi:hypothetical protein F441_23106, partial [Phytophthora nicotianae CJ01A1]